MFTSWRTRHRCSQACPTNPGLASPSGVGAWHSGTKGRGRRAQASQVAHLESSVDLAGRPVASRGWTDLVFTSQRGLKVVDGLLTGFHDPKAAHMAMLEAIAGRGHLQRVYGVALETGYLWHEFGDLHLILPD